MTIGHDKKAIQHDQLKLSLDSCPSGPAFLKDWTKPHHYAVMSSPVAWTLLDSGRAVLNLDGATRYGCIAAADSADLNIIAQDYSVVGWVYYQVTGLSQIIIGRYGVDLDGWEVYLYDINHTLSLRHHHVSLAPTRTGCYSTGWTTGAWHLFGISRSGAYPLMYHNGEEVEVTYDVGGLNDPDTCNRDLVIGTRYTKDANWYSGYMDGLRVWVGKNLTAEEHKHIFNTERRWFDV